MRSTYFWPAGLGKGTWDESGSRDFQVLHHSKLLCPEALPEHTLRSIRHQGKNQTSPCRELAQVSPRERRSAREDDEVSWTQHRRKKKDRQNNKLPTLGASTIQWHFLYPDKRQHDKKRLLMKLTKRFKRGANVGLKRLGFHIRKHDQKYNLCDLNSSGFYNIILLIT